MASKIVVNLDTSKEFFLNSKCKQNDDLTLECNIFENGLVKDLTNCSIVIQALKADRTYIIQNTDITKESNKFTANLVRDFTRVAGETEIEIVLTESSKQNTTFSFSLEVVGSVIRGAVESGNTVTILENLQDKIEEAGVVKQETEQLIEKGGAATKGDIQEVNAHLETNVQYLKDIEVSPLLFGAKGDGVTDDTIPFSMCMDYCIENKKTMQITPGYVFAISSIEKTIKSDNGFTMRGNGQQSVIKVINTENKEGIKLNVAGNFRVINVGSFKIIGNPKSGSGLVVVRAVRPSQVYNIIGTEFTNVNVAPVKLIDCIDIQPKNIYSRKVSNGILLEGQCDGCDIHKITVYDWSEYAINVTPAIETTTSLLENSICLSIYEPYFYGTGELTDNHEGKVAINLVDCEKFSLYGGWFEQCEYALKGMVGDKNTGCPNSSIINPKRGGSIKPKIYLEKSSNSFIQSQSLDVELASNCENCFVIATSIISVTENGKNTILARDGFNLSNLCIMDSRGGYKPIITEGLSYSTLSIQSEGEKVLTLNNTVGTIEIIATTTRGLIAKYQYRIGSNPFNFPITSNENVVTGIDLSEFTDSKINISFNSDKTIKIVNKTSSTKTLKIILN